jgi:dihydrofolate reductase
MTRRNIMGKIVITENITLDGVVQDPTGAEGLPQGGWFSEFGGKDLAEWNKVAFDEALAAEGLLLGRRSDEWFATIWESRTGPFAERLNSMPKYVVSATLTRPRWSNSTLLKGDAVTEVTNLKRQTDGDIVVIGSIRLAHTLIAHDLADELRLTVYPVALGTGERLFPATDNKKPLRLTATRTIGAGLTHLTYEFVRDA